MPVTSTPSGVYGAVSRPPMSRIAASGTTAMTDRATALREAGDVILAISDGALNAGDLIPMAEVVNGGALSGDRPVVFKSTGMSWEDLVIAEAIVDAYEA